MIMLKKLLARKPGALNALYITQFLSAFADNVIFFSILGIATRHGITRPDDYMADVQTAFLLAYVVLAPIVGALADKHAKSHILMLGNLIKAAGILLILAGIHPVLCYAVVGVGAVVYSPAKYGILTELTANDEQLLRANGMLESYTIVAILTGTLTGGVLADLSETAGTAACIALYAASLAMTFWIPRMKGRRNVEYGRSIREFFRETGQLFANRKTHFALVGNGAFWMVAAVLRIAFLAWLPVYLHIFGKTEQSAIFSCTAIGIVIGSLLTPKLVKVGKYYRSILYGFLMVVVICAAPFLQNVVLICIALLLVGFLGGVFVIPMNTVLQAEGERMIGSGKTIAIQNMVQNMLMIVGLVLFKLAGAAGMSLIATIVGLAALLLLFVLYICRFALTARMNAE